MNEMTFFSDVESEKNSGLTEKTVTTRELAEVLGVEKRTIQETANRLLSANVLSHLETKSVVGGKTFVFDEEQATLIKQEIQKHHNLASRQVEEKMDIKTVAEIIGYDEEYLRKKCAELGFTRNGVKTLLNERQVTQLKNILIPRTSDMKIRGQENKTELEILQNASRAFIDLQRLYKQKEAEYEAIIAEQKPKADFVDMKECAKVINFQGWGRNKIFELLRQKSVLDRSNQPYQRYCDMQYFRIIESKYVLPTGEVKISLKTVVYQKGLDFIRKLIEKEENEHKKPLKMLAE